MATTDHILITGHLGFIGKHLHKLFPKSDGIDIKDGSGDIRGKLPKKNYSHIFHLAALRSVPLGEMYPQEFVETNCFGTLNLAKTYPKARILNISSSAAEEHKGVYGLTKWFTEQIRHPNWLSCRLYNVFGEGQPISSGAITPKILRALKYNGAIGIDGTGHQTRDFTYVGDVVESLKNLMFSEKTGLAHVSYKEPISVRDYIELWVSIARREIGIEYIAPRAGDVLHSPIPLIAHCSNTYGRKEGMKRTWKNYVQNHV